MSVAATGAERKQHLVIDPSISAPCCNSLGTAWQFGIETFGLNLTRPQFAVPVARVIAPGLQPDPPRLLRLD